MRKRAEISALSKIIGWAIVLFLLLFFFLAYYSGEGLLRKPAQWFNDFADNMFRELGIGKENPARNLEIDGKVKEYFDYLYNSLNQVEQNSDCVLVYQQNPNLDDYRLDILNANSGLYMRLYDKKEMVEADFLPKTGSGRDIVPCIIAGSQNQAENFYRCKVEKIEAYCNKPMYTASDEISLEKLYTLRMDSKKYDLEDKSLTDYLLLYNFDGRHKCFFTTNDWFKFDKDGMEDRFLEIIFKDDKVKKCTSGYFCDKKDFQCKDYENSCDRTEDGCDDDVLKEFCDYNSCRVEGGCTWQPDVRGGQGSCVPIP